MMGALAGTQAFALSIAMSMSLILSGRPAAAAGEHAITVTDLLQRAQIPLAVISPGGHLSAYLLMKANPADDVYDISVCVADAKPKAPPRVLARYQLLPRDAISEVGVLVPGAGDLRWLSDDELLYTVRSAGKTDVVAWSRSTGRARVVLKAHDRIAFNLSDTVGDRATRGQVRVIATDLSRRTIEVAEAVPDHSWRMIDAYRFDHPFHNPKTGLWARNQTWIASVAGLDVTVVSAGNTYEGWDTSPLQFEWPKDWPAIGADVSPASAAASMTIPYDEVSAPNGRGKVVSEEHQLPVRNTGRTVSHFGLSFDDGQTRRELVPHVGKRRPLRPLGWSESGSKVYYIENRPQETLVNSVDLSGTIEHIFTSAAALDVPGRFFGRRNVQNMSDDGRYALFIRSSNTMPDELVRVDLEARTLSVLASPNDIFREKDKPITRFYSIGDPDGEVWGRLYLPLGYKVGRRYPLVVTHYVSTNGFLASVGDEIPIIPLTDTGIAVFAMHSGNLNKISSRGNIEADVDRVQRPLEAMEWIITKLTREGIVDPRRVGLTGLSYGSEIAMYAYWKSESFRAVSVAAPGLDPFDHLVLGPDFSRWLVSRGLPWPDAAGLEPWKQLSAGLNARADLPPLMIQSGQEEEILTEPVWTRLRRAGAQIDWFDYPNEGHEKVGPANKWWVYQRNLDWFDFWLNEHEDPDPRKAELYKRWEAMRAEVSAHGVGVRRNGANAQP